MRLVSLRKLVLTGSQNGIMFDFDFTGIGLAMEVVVVVCLSGTDNDEAAVEFDKLLSLALEHSTDRIFSIVNIFITFNSNFYKCSVLKSLPLVKSDYSIYHACNSSVLNKAESYPQSDHSMTYPALVISPCFSLPHYFIP